MLSQVAIFKLNRTFNLTGRGQVLVGNLEKGKVDKGNIIRLSTERNSLEFKVISVEVVDTLKEHTAELGLVIDPADAKLLAGINAATGKECAILE